MSTAPPQAPEMTLTKIGDPVIRVDGRAKVTGTAKYAAEFEVPNVAYGVMVTSTIANGRITRIDSMAAERAPGVVTIMTPSNAPKLPKAGKAGVDPPAGRVLQLLQDADVHYNNQPIAVVVADTLNQALLAASLLDVRYQEAPPKLDFEAGFSDAHTGKNKVPALLTKGDVPTGFDAAEVKIDQVYTTPKENHNPMEPHATIAQWDGELLTLHDSTQYIFGVKKTIAKTLGIPEDNVRVLCPFTGGGFGCKGSTWSHVVLAAMAAKVAKRPVKLVLERPQMFGPVGGRPQTRQHIILGAKRDGTLTGIRHDVYSHTSMIEDFVEPASAPTRMLYAAPVITTSQKLVSLNVGTPTFQRAPGEAPGSFAFESAMDELAYELKMDPIALRLKNYAEVDPTSRKPFSGKNLRECYTQAADKFGWSKRNPQPRSHRAGHELIGYGMATATYPANRSSAQASVTFMPNGRVTVASGTQDLGTGTYTIMAQVAAAALGMPIRLIDAKLGDTRQPKGVVSGGSQTAASTGPAIQAAAQQAVLKLVTLEIGNTASPFHGAQPDDLDFKDGKLFRKSAPASGIPFIEVVARNGNQPVEAKASVEASESVEEFAQHSWGAVFAEVAVDETLGMARVRRVTAVYDVGTLLNERTGKSQLIGGIVWAVGLVLEEETHIDPKTGRPVNNNLAEYHVPVNLDIGEIDVSALGIPDKNFNPLGARGIGEIGITGASAAIANAIHHATGKRIREAPITPDNLLG
jgi:xanthine dehydrogenase YagR molybdenum-binding subunit